MNSRQNNLYIAWVPFQRRAQSLAQAFSLKTCYYHYSWGEGHRIFRLLSWFAKAFATLMDLIRNKPEYVFIQLAPTPLLYVTALYCAFSKCKYVSDCHNTMLYDGHNIHWPLAKYLLRRSVLVVVHNDDVNDHAKRQGIEALILRDPLPVLEAPENIHEVGGLNLKNDSYVIVPGSMAEDEPIEELFDAARAVPETRFVMTWFAERLPADLKARVPDNLVFTGFLDEPEFNALYRNANVAIVLTTREGTQPSGASEAISLGIPLVVSQIATTQRLYKEHPVYVTNTAESIAEGVRTALSDYSKWSESIADLRGDLVAEADKQIAQVKQLLSIN